MRCFYMLSLIAVMSSGSVIHSRSKRTKKSRSISANVFAELTVHYRYGSARLKKVCAQFVGASRSINATHALDNALLAEL